MTRSIQFFHLQSIFLLSCVALSVMRLSTARIFGNETDRLALLAFKGQSIVAQELPGAMSSWNNSLHFCEWGGVTCSHRHQRVILLNLSSQGMTGSISPHIGNLSFLRSIFLENNSLHGEIPQEIGRLFRLQTLRMSNNSLSGEIPVNLSHCSNMLSLDLRNNKLSGKIPAEFGFLEKLNLLHLASNNLTGPIPSSFGNLSSIKTLFLGGNSLTGSIPNSLGHLKSITVLALHQNMLFGTVSPSLYNLSSLEALSLTGNHFVGSLPREMGLKLPNLQTLLVGNNQFSGSIPSSLFSNATGIKSLGLTNNSFTGEVPMEIGNLKGIEKLNLEINYLGSGKVDDLNFITSLVNCSNLKLLSISWNRFGGKLPNSLANLSIELDTLYLGNNRIFGSIPSGIVELSNLIALSIRSNLLSGTIPQGIGMLRNLQMLLLNGNTFSGQIPHSIGNISSLYFLDLSNNILERDIPTNFENCRFLDELYLAHNHLTGIVPKQVLELSKLTYLDMSYNNLVGSLPSEVGSLTNLRGLAISNNKMTGEIPDTLGSCLSLEELYLHGNFFHGIIPSSFRHLSGMEDMDLSLNNLSGNIPKDLENLPVLLSLNLSFNHFEGEVPTRGVFQNVSAISVVGNDKLCGGIVELNLPKCHVQNSKRRETRLPLKITLSVLLPSFVISSLLLALYWRKKPSARSFMKDIGNTLQRVSYKELHDATNGFCSESLIGMGNYGSVHKGVLRKDESVVAVKVLNLMERGASKSFIAECEVLKEVRHRNLLKILTVCSSVDFKGNDFKALIFEFMSNGSLENWLHQGSERIRTASRSLNLLQRLNIATDVASAVDYLHNYSTTPIVHCDLKPSNVLLDDDMVAYVGDFGLAKFVFKINSNFDKSETSSIAPRGTIGYIPPEYGMGAEVSTKGDVYSFGIMLLEMFTGMRPTNEMFKDGLSLHSFCKGNLTERVMDVLDVHLLPDEVSNGSTIDDDIEVQRGMTAQMKDCLISIIKIGIACSSESTVERLDIKDVVTEIKKIKEAFVKSRDRAEL